MKLYHAPGSCSRAICIVAEEAGIDLDIVAVDPRKHRLVESDANFYDIHELGYVPLLQLDDGTFLREGPVIAQYLADQRPATQLVPMSGTMARYRMLEWMNFLSTEIHKGFIPLLYAVAAGKYVNTARAKLQDRFAWLNQRLAGTMFLMGEGFTIADAYLFALTSWGKATWIDSVYHADIDLSDLEHLRAWYERVENRASVQRVLGMDAEAAA